MSTRGKTLDEVGFIHCSTQDQIDATAEYVYGDFEGSLLLLEMDLDRLRGFGLDVRFEDGGDGRLFPHIYGALPCALVESVSPFTRG